MKDRAVEHPERYRIVPVEGTDNIVDLVPVPGEVTEEGTPINKSTLLRDETANILKITSGDPTVDDAFLSVFSRAMGSGLVRLIVTVNGKPATAGIPISGATTVDGQPIVTTGADSYLCLISSDTTEISTPEYVDMPASTKAVNVVLGTFTTIEFALTPPAAGEKVFTVSGTHQFSPYATDMDMCLVGGGGGGQTGGWNTDDESIYLGGDGGYGGFVKNYFGISVTPLVAFQVAIGAGGHAGQYTVPVNTSANMGGKAPGLQGGTTSVTLPWINNIYSANGGSGGGQYNAKGNGKGGTGAYSQGAIDGGDGGAATVKTFGEDSYGIQYSGGGAGAPSKSYISWGGSVVTAHWGTPGAPNGGPRGPGGGGNGNDGFMPSEHYGATVGATSGAAGAVVLRWRVSA